VTPLWPKRNTHQLCQPSWRPDCLAQRALSYTELMDIADHRVAPYFELPLCNYLYSGTIPNKPGGREPFCRLSS
jgi:hypothetical protein